MNQTFVNRDLGYGGINLRQTPSGQWVDQMGDSYAVDPLTGSAWRTTKESKWAAKTRFGVTSQSRLSAS